MTVQGKAVLIGGGKVGRGFLGHLAFRSGYSLTFVDSNPELVSLMRERRGYRLHFLGAPAKDETISPIQAFRPDAPEIETSGREADVIFVSVGGPNLREAGDVLARMLRARAETATPLNVIVGENWPNAAAELRAAVGGPSSRVGVAESTILRSCIEPTEAQRAADPLSLQCQDYWELPVNADALMQPWPRIAGLIPTPHFENALQRKVYTYNAINATIAYLGFHRGHTYLADAAVDPIVLKHALVVMHEVNQALCLTFAYSSEDQGRYATQALEKFQNQLIKDPIERQVRDPIRKLGRKDRLVGPAMLALDAGITPTELALSIAAALQYRNPSDPAAARLEQLIKEYGPLGALSRVTGLSEDHPLATLVAMRYDEVPRLGQE